jgi:hypothetical protein
MIEYGLISKLDASVIEQILELICEDFSETISYCEIGVYNGKTSEGVKKFLDQQKRQSVITGIENFANNEKLVFFPIDGNLIAGNSSEVYNLLDDESQHLIFIDGNHSFPSVVSDFYCYSDKVKVGGYLAFHDTGPHIKEFKDYQGMGSFKDPDMYISVRKALSKLGLLENKLEAWDLIADEWDEKNEAGGVCVFKRIK